MEGRQARTMRRTQEDVDYDLERLREALAEPRTMRYLTARFRVCRQTIYRWFETLQAEGVPIRRVGVRRPTRFLAQ